MQLAEKVRAAGATIVAITNVADGPLAKLAQVPIVIPSALDHAISVVTYTTLALAAGILGASVTGSFTEPMIGALRGGIAAAGRAIPGWQQQIAESAWLMPSATTYFWRAARAWAARTKRG